MWLADWLVGRLAVGRPQACAECAVRARMRAVTDGAGAGAGAGLRVASLRFGRACVRACGQCAQYSRSSIDSGRHVGGRWSQLAADGLAWADVGLLGGWAAFSRAFWWVVPVSCRPARETRPVLFIRAQQGAAAKPRWTALNVAPVPRTPITIRCMTTTKRANRAGDALAAACWRRSPAFVC